MESFERRSLNELREKINNVEDLLNDYADFALMFADVKVEIRDFEDASLMVSNDLKSSFNRSGVSVNSIQKVDLGLNYNRGEQFFKINRAALQFDNGYIVEFAQSPKLAEEKLYYFQVAQQNGKVVSKTDESSCLPEERVHKILLECGITIPSQPERAEWSSIAQILQSTRNWESKAEHTMPVEPYPNTQLVISDHVVSNNPSFESGFEYLGTALVRELSAGIEKTENFEETPTTCLKFVGRSDSIFETPKFVRAERVPVTYEPPFGGMPPTDRTEHFDNAQLLTPNFGIIDTVYSSLNDAYQSQFKLI